MERQQTRKSSFDWSSQVVLVTGGTGSFGGVFVDAMLSCYHPSKLIIFSRDEMKQHDMRRSLPEGGSTSVQFVLGDVRDLGRLRLAMRGADVVVHAAALKQIPDCEFNPSEAVLTNVAGAQNVITAALEAGVSRVVGISTDKAVSPVSVYGASKLLAEKLFVQANEYSSGGVPGFSSVRYGNVSSSRGSVVPLFMKQRATGKITVTDTRMTRFLIVLRDGVDFVVRCIEQMHGGEIFVPKVPAMHIMDLVEAIAPGCEVEHIGPRPGEKISELLLSRDEAQFALEFDDMFVIEPRFSWWRKDYWPQGKPLPEGFEYQSDTVRRLTVDELRQLAETQHEE